MKIYTEEELLALYQYLLTFLIWGVFQSKGGVGKSLVALTMAVQRAIEGGVVVMFDLDSSNPSLTTLFLAFETDRRQHAILRREIFGNRRNTTVTRYLLQPELGLSDILLTFPVESIVAQLPRTVDLAQTFARDELGTKWGIDIGTISRQTLAHYGSADGTIGELHLVPNGGSLDELITEGAAIRAKHPNYNPDMLMLIALSTLQREFVAKGRRPVTDVILDIGGETGNVANNAAMVIQKALLPFKRARPSVEGLCTTARELSRIQRLRPDGGQGLEILPPLGNFWRNRKTSGTYESLLGLMRDVGLTPADIHIPIDMAAGDVSEELDLIPFACNPLSPAMLAIDQYRKQYINVEEQR